MSIKTCLLLNTASGRDLINKGCYAIHQLNSFEKWITYGEYKRELQLIKDLLFNVETMRIHSEHGYFLRPLTGTMMIRERVNYLVKEVCKMGRRKLKNGNRKISKVKGFVNQKIATFTRDFSILIYNMYEVEI